jgi:hypothetical protein
LLLGKGQACTQASTNQSRLTKQTEKFRQYSNKHSLWPFHGKGPSLASFPDGKLSQSVAQIQNNLADLGNADSGEKALDCVNFRLKIIHFYHRISLTEPIASIKDRESRLLAVLLRTLRTN